MVISVKKIKILVKNGNFCKKIKILVKNCNWCKLQLQLIIDAMMR